MRLGRETVGEDNASELEGRDGVKAKHLDPWRTSYRWEGTKEPLQGFDVTVEASAYVFPPLPFFFF